jgi:hypothetical protein
MSLVLVHVLPACLLACLPACLLACLPACLLACLPACLLACLPACLLACLQLFRCRFCCLPALAVRLVSAAAGCSALLWPRCCDCCDGPALFACCALPSSQASLQQQRQPQGVAASLSRRCCVLQMLHNLLHVTPLQPALLTSPGVRRFVTAGASSVALIGNGQLRGCDVLLPPTSAQATLLNPSA